VTAEDLLVVEDIHTYYGEAHILQGVSISVGAGEVVTLIGRNGAGKTTTLRSIMGIARPAGRIALAGEGSRGGRPRSSAGASPGPEGARCCRT
jgi:branched-chain amino acid transport system ATP-binding protein